MLFLAQTSEWEVYSKFRYITGMKVEGLQQ
jgi:hypothetical protein